MARRRPENKIPSDQEMRSVTFASKPSRVIDSEKADKFGRIDAGGHTERGRLENKISRD